MTSDTEMKAWVEKVGIKDGDLVVVRTEPEPWFRPEDFEQLDRRLKENGVTAAGYIAMRSGDSVETISTSDLFRLLEKRIVPDSPSDEELLGPKLEKYVSINVSRDEANDVFWLVMLFPDETVVRLPLDAKERQELMNAVGSGDGAVKVKVGNG